MLVQEKKTPQSKNTGASDSPTRSQAQKSEYARSLFKQEFLAQLKVQLGDSPVNQDLYKMMANGSVPIAFGDLSEQERLSNGAQIHAVSVLQGHGKVVFNQKILDLLQSETDPKKVRAMAKDVATAFLPVCSHELKHVKDYLDLKTQGVEWPGGNIEFEYSGFLRQMLTARESIKKLNEIASQAKNPAEKERAETLSGIIEEENGTLIRAFMSRPKGLAQLISSRYPPNFVKIGDHTQEQLINRFTKTLELLAPDAPRLLKEIVTQQLVTVKDSKKLEILKRFSQKLESQVEDVWDATAYTQNLDLVQNSQAKFSSLTAQEKFNFIDALSAVVAAGKKEDIAKIAIPSIKSALESSDINPQSRINLELLKLCSDNKLDITGWSKEKYEQKFTAFVETYKRHPFRSASDLDPREIANILKFWGEKAELPTAVIDEKLKKISGRE